MGLSRRALRASCGLGALASSCLVLVGVPAPAWASPAAASSVSAGSGADGSASLVATVTVNVRSAAATSSNVVATLDHGHRVVPAGGARDGWQPITFRGGLAYVSTTYLRPSGDSSTEPPAEVTPGSKVSMTALNLRSGPSATASVVTVLPAGTTLAVGAKQEHGFAQTATGTTQGWVSMAYLANVAPTPASAAQPAAAPAAAETKGQVALAFAHAQLGEPYRFGATGPGSWDCSGLTQAAWRAAGVAIPRTSQQQFVGIGRRVARSALRPGDLVFFYGPHPSHVGLYVGGGKIIAAPRPGRSVSDTTVSSMPYAGAVRPG